MRTQFALAVALLFATLASPAQAHESDALPGQAGGHNVPDDEFWNIVQGFTTKTGYRLVFLWDTDAPIAGVVEWGFTPTGLTNQVVPTSGGPDTANMAFHDIASNAAAVQTRINAGQDEVYFQVRDLATDEVSPLQSFPLGNAWTSDASDGSYEVDLVWAIDSQALPDLLPFDAGLNDIAAAADIFAERVWDMTDGYVRIGNVLVMDTNAFSSRVPFGANGQLGGLCPPTPPETPADVGHTLADFYMTSDIPFDSHTWGSGGTSRSVMVDSSCVGVNLGRLGQLVLPWGLDAGGDEAAHLGYTATHEFGHYALGSPDLYDVNGASDCDLPDGAVSDISVMDNSGGWMGNRWEQTELDRRPSDCPDSASSDASWDRFQLFYGAGRAGGAGIVPEQTKDAIDQTDSNPLQLEGNPDGGALDIYVLDRTPLGSRIQRLGAPIVEPEGEATLQITAPGPGATVSGGTVVVSGTVDREGDGGGPSLSVDAGGPYSGGVGAAIAISGSATGGTAPYACAWAGSGATFESAASCSTTVSFASAGAKEVTLTVTDGASATGGDTANVTITSGGGFPATSQEITTSYTPFNSGSPLAYSSLVAVVTGLNGDPVPKFLAGQPIDFNSRFTHSTGPALAASTPAAYFVYDANGVAVAGPLAAPGIVDQPTAGGCTTPPCYNFKATWTPAPDSTGQFFFVLKVNIEGAEYYIRHGAMDGARPGLKEIELVGTPGAPSPGGDPTACAAYWLTGVGSPEEAQAAEDCDTFLQGVTGSDEDCGIYSEDGDESDPSSCMSAAGLAAAPLPAPAAPPSNAEITDPSGDAVIPTGSPFTQEDIRAAWFDEDSDFLYVGMKVEDIPADSTATSFVNYAVNFKPDWTNTWSGVPAGNTFTGLRVTALYSPVTAGGPSATTQYELQHLSTSAAGSNFGTAAVLDSSALSVDTDVIWWVIPKTALTGVAPGDALTTLSAAAAPAVGGVVTFGTAFGDMATSAATYTFATTATVPGAPTGLIATPGNGQVSLAWTAPSSNGGSAITGYTVNYGTNSGSLGSTQSASGTSATVAGLTNGQAYFFTVKATNGVGTGPATAEASATPSDLGPTERVELYEGTTLLGSTTVTSTQTGGAVAWSKAVTLAVGAHTVTAKWFDVGEASTGTPLDSADVTFTVEGEEVDPCAGDPAPIISNIAATPAETTATVAWTTNEASGSLVRYGLTTSYGSTASTAGAVTAHSVALSGLSASTTYRYQVESTDACAKTTTSADGTFTTEAGQVVETAPFVTIDSPVDGVTLEDGETAFSVTGTAGQVAQDLGGGGDSNGDGFVVIAVPDTGINPYHNEFRGTLYPRNTDADTANDVDFALHPSAYLDGFPASATKLDLTINGGFNKAADSAKFAAVAPNTLYWIPGTKIIGAVDAGNAGTANGAADTMNLFDDDGHGTASASVAAGNVWGSCANCLIVAVESFEGVKWAAQQPWIDIVTVSGGTIANVGGPVLFGNEQTFTKVAAERGQSILAAAGNGCLAYVCPEQTYTSNRLGPDWVMRVGALQAYDDGTEQSILLSGKPVDISSFSGATAGAPYKIPAACGTNAAGNCPHSGTSSATPITAGHMGEVLLRARTLLGDTGIGTQKIGGAGVVASGPAVPSSPYLSDGALTRAELWDITLNSASDLGASGWIGFPFTVGSSPASYAYAGYGLADDEMEARAIRVLEGTTPRPSNLNADDFFLLDSQVRTELWGSWDDDADTVPGFAGSSLDLADLGLDARQVALDPDLLIDAFAALEVRSPAMSSSACPGAPGASVKLYLDSVHADNLLGTDDLASPVGVCSDGWTVPVDLSTASPGNHALIAVYSDGNAGTAQDSINVTLDLIQTLADGDVVQVTLAAPNEEFFKVEVPAGVGLVSVAMTGPSCDSVSCPLDVDLYVRNGAKPTDDAYACRPFQTGNDEACDIQDPAAGTWFVRLDAYSGTGTVTLAYDLDLPDLDGDGTPDARDADRDGDGLSNDLETLLGSDPGDAGSTPATGPSACVPGTPDSFTQSLTGWASALASGTPGAVVTPMADECPIGLDRDGDGVRDDRDAFPDDAAEWVDSDGDGVGDNGDAFPNNPAEWKDSDGDGVGDNRDAFPNDPTESRDSDGDGVGDNADICSGFNDGADADGDGIPNGCDTCPATSGGCDLDKDGDNHANAADNCPSKPNPGQDDLDGDGRGDVCDNDRDGDGYSNGRELAQGSDPDDPSSTPRGA